MVIGSTPSVYWNVLAVYHYTDFGELLPVFIFLNPCPARDNIYENDSIK